MAILQGAACDQQNYSPALDALKCCADRLPVSLQLLDTYATSDRDTALALMRGELCVAALTALHPLSSGEASSTATQLQVDRLLPLRVCAEAGGGKGGSHGRSGSGSGDGDGDGGSTSGPRVGPGVTAVLEIQEIKSSSAGAWVLRVGLKAWTGHAWAGRPYTWKAHARPTAGAFLWP